MSAFQTGDPAPNNTLAERIFQTQFKVWEQEDALSDGLASAGMPDGWNDFWTDHYDASIEFGFVEPEFIIPQSALDYLWSVGFVRCWVNYNKDKALYFSRDVPAPGVDSHAHGSKVADGVERKRLRAEIARLTMDVERLTWLDENCKRENSTIRVGTEMKSCTAWAISSTPGRSLRETIDLVRAAQQEKS